MIHEALSVLAVSGCDAALPVLMYGTSQLITAIRQPDGGAYQSLGGSKGPLASVRMHAV